MTNVDAVEATGMVFLSDRWGDPLGDVLDPHDVDAVARLAGYLAECSEFGFVARDTDGTYGIRLEYEFVWRVSDDEDEVVWSWGDLTDEQILAAVTAWVSTMNAVAHDLGLSAGVVVTGAHEMYMGRLGACWFVPESNAASAGSLSSALSEHPGPLGVNTAR